MPPSSVALLVTCLVDLFYPDVGAATVRLLRRRGLRVTVPAGQTCCALPLFNSGYRAEAARVARRTIPLFAEAEAVVVPSGSCAWMVKAEYPHLFPGEAAMTEAAERLAGKTWELSQLLAATGRAEGPAPPPAGPPDPGAGARRAGRPVRVTYHDSCHLLRGLGESRAARGLLRAADGVELVELPGADECCGFGGSFSVRLPDVSGAILARKLEQVRSTGAEAVVACDAGCLLQMGGGAARAGDAVRVLHLAELLAEVEGT